MRTWLAVTSLAIFVIACTRETASELEPVPTHPSVADLATMKQSGQTSSVVIVTELIEMPDSMPTSQSTNRAR